jgi:adenylate cyclase
VGNIGAPDRLNYSVVGNTVNLASRVEGLNRFYGTTVLATESVMAAAGDDLIWRFLDYVVVKGQTNRVRIYEPLGREGEVSGEKLRLKSLYEAAWAAMQKRQFQEALRLLRKEDGFFLNVRSVKRLEERCEKFVAQPPPEDWDTSFVFLDK